MTNTSEETTPQRARRLGKAYADEFFDRWNASGRKWIKIAFGKGYQTACENIADEIDALTDSTEDIDIYVKQVNAILDRYDTRPAA